MTLGFIAAHDVPQENHSAFAYGMTSAMAEYLDALTHGDTTIGRARLALAQDLVKGALKSSQLDNSAERVVAQALLDAIRKVDLV